VKKFQFELSSTEAYGEVDENAIVDVPKSAFMVNGAVDENLLQVGNTIPMQDTAGNRMNGRVTNLSDSSVTMDFNHPLAGQQLHFSGTVAELRQATQEEIEGTNNSCGCSGCGCSEEEKGASGCC
jgi:FKBP-type peptidyl-prolyl cis-trans isomerase SlyD